MTRLLPLLLLLACDDKADDTTDPIEDTKVDQDLDTDAEPEPEPEPEDLSEADQFSEQACDSMEDTAEELILASSSSEAAQLTIVADGMPRRLVMPESGDGWLMIEITDWMAYLRLFTDEGVEIEIIDGEVLTEALINGSCPDAGMTDQLWNFHSWGSYAVRVPEGSPDEVWFVAIVE